MKNITIKQVAFSTLAISIFTAGGASQVSKNVLHMPNVVFVLADEWRAQAAGFNGNKDVQTPNLDRLADRAVNFTNTISGCPVCTPYRGSLLTGQYP
ncbi:MAG: sulfatase-like hydrolase/transferase, partial [Bacteroidetes bacterium]|nr:sulfatase-like hydrolase/transferase [Bacteroidota bacterium]